MDMRRAEGLVEKVSHENILPLFINCSHWVWLINSHSYNYHFYDVNSVNSQGT